jgi:DNA-binding IclR family transcriptional regulator
LGGVAAADGRGVAVPLTDSGGAVLGSVSITGPTSRVDDERSHEELPSLLREAAKVVELDLTYS